MKHIKTKTEAAANNSGTNLKSQMSREAFLKKLGITIGATSLIVSGCNKDDDNKNGKGGGIISMTTSGTGTFEIGIAGTGSVTIDWGDGKGKETFSLSSLDRYWTNDDGIHSSYSLKEKYSYKHYFSGGNRTITITGENIMALYRGWDVSNPINFRFPLTSLDVSGCKTLIDLDCGFNQLTNLNIRKNTNLINLNCMYNFLTESALNALFESLPDRNKSEYGLIAIKGNPDSYNNPDYPSFNSGTESCNQNIATAKNWVVLPNNTMNDLTWIRERINNNSWE